ncbi:MAG: hypothetical protein ACRDZO_15505 [Egibacteraceae bacterium]
MPASPACHAVQFGVGGEPQRGLQPYFHGAGWEDAGVAHHGGVHERRRVERIGRDAKLANSSARSKVAMTCASLLRR